MKNYQETRESGKEKPSAGTEDVCRLFEAWLEDTALRVKPSTYESYYRCMNQYVIPFLSRIRIRKLRRNLFSAL